MSWAHVGLTGDYLWANAASARVRPMNDPADRLYRAARPMLFVRAEKRILANKP